MCNSASNNTYRNVYMILNTCENTREKLNCFLRSLKMRCTLSNIIIYSAMCELYPITDSSMNIILKPLLSVVGSTLFFFSMTASAMQLGWGSKVTTNKTDPNGDWHPMSI